MQNDAGGNTYHCAVILSDLTLSLDKAKESVRESKDLRLLFVARWIYHLRSQSD
jgi:hypothetical protein